MDSRRSQKLGRRWCEWFYCVPYDSDGHQVFCNDQHTEEKFAVFSHLHTELDVRMDIVQLVKEVLTSLILMARLRRCHPRTQNIRGAYRYPGRVLFPE
jgi:hypothetical protein